MPGMAASPRIFEYLSLPDQFELIKLSWFQPYQNEPLSEYAKRMCAQIKHKEPVLLGVSFGGMLVQEMAKHIKCRKVIIVSSVKNYNELPLHMKLAKKTRAHKLFPLQWITWIENLAVVVFGPTIRSKVEAYQLYLSERDPDYLSWSMDSIVHWDQEKAEHDIIHIHGEKDTVFPIRYIDQKTNFYLVKNATHAMILTHARWFNLHLSEIILKV